MINQRLGFFVSTGDREFESRPVQRGPSTMPVNSSAVQRGNAASVLGTARPGENLDEIYYL